MQPACALGAIWALRFPRPPSGGEGTGANRVPPAGFLPPIPGGEGDAGPRWVLLAAVLLAPATPMLVSLAAEAALWQAR